MRKYVTLHITTKMALGLNNAHSQGSAMAYCRLNTFRTLITNKKRTNIPKNK